MSLAVPPKAARKPHTATFHGVRIEDPYAWLQDPSYPEVTEPEILAYLEAENAYFESAMRPHEALVHTIFEELKGRQQEEDESVPYEKNGYRYQWRFAKGAQYRTWLRASVASPDDWQVILDEPALAHGKDYFRLGAIAVSPDGGKLGYSTDTDGSERFTLEVIDIETREPLMPPIDKTLGPPVWNADGDELYYVEVNEQWRPCRVHHRHLAAPDQDRVVYDEPDDSFFVGIGLSQSEAYVWINTGDHVTNETHFVARDRLAEPLALITERVSGHEYDVEHWQDRLGQDRFVIRSNFRQANFDLFTANVGTSTPPDWTLLSAGGKDRYITAHLAFASHLVIGGRELGLDQIWIRDVDGHEHTIEFPEASYSLDFGTNPSYETETLRLGYTSMVTPSTVYDYDIAERSLTTRKVQEIPSGYEPARFRTQRLMANARDGASVPISLVHHEDTPLDGSAPAYLYAYGAYGHAISPSFSSARISLLERGFVYAIAHIRGGDDLGYDWYTQGKLMQRTNTFHDFIDCARHLVDAGVTRTGRIAIAGGSAGGELMGAVVNEAPELWGAVAAHVPFVDVLNTMLNADLPLTPIEWPEWGNPIEDKDAFDYIRSYSPYDHVAAKAYPPMFVTAGLNDPRVTYWEPAKWVAKLRHLKTDDNLLLLKTNMGAGHGGKSGRYDALHEVAEEYAFILSALELLEQ